MSNLSLREIAQSQLDSTPVIDGQLIVCLDTGNAYRDTATAHVKIGSDLEVVSDLPLAPLAEKIYYLKPDKLYVFLGGNWTLLNDKTIDLDEAIAKLPAESSTTLNDDVEIITQDTDITQPHYYRRKLVVLWKYIKTKAQDFFAAKNHQHGKADITDFPTSMPASDVYPWAKAATKPSYTKAEVGLGKVDNTADADKTVKRATTSGTADSANSVAWKNVRDKPTTFPVEAHNHDDRYYTEAEIDGKLEKKSSTDHTHDLSELISALSIDSSTTLNDSVQIITQDTDTANQKYYRRPLTVLWNYIKSKADSVYSAIGHNHKIQNLEEYTTRVYDATIVRPADTVLASPQDKDGIATFRKLDKNDVGLENVDNTADKNKNVATAGIATTGVRDYNNANNIIKIGWSGTELDADSLTYVAGYTSDKKIHPASKDGVRSWLGLGAAAYKKIQSLSAVGHTDWKNQSTDDGYVPTMAFMAFWNGAFDGSGSSNLQYCDRGRFGTIVTKNTGDYAVAGHTHNSIKDIGNNSSDTTFAYSKAGMNYGDYTWLAGWNGYELRAVNKSQFAVAGHTHSFINSVGVKNAQTGRNQIYGDVYSYNSNASANTGMPTTYTSTIGFGQGSAGTVEICGEWTGGKGLWSRALRDYQDNWYDWQRIYTDNYHPSAGYADSAGSVAWGNVSGKPSSYPPSSHSHAYLPLGGGTISGAVTANTYYAPNWFRATGDSGFYFENHGGGWYMIDDTWIRAYNNKNIYTPGVIQCDSGFNGNLNGNATTSTLVRHQGNVTAISGTATRTAGLQLYGAYTNGYPMAYGNVICASNGAFGSEIALDCVGGDGKQGPGRMYYRNRSDWGTSEWSDWATIAYLTDKVAGAGTADNAEYLANDSAYMRMHWNGQSGQPTWLWGGNDASNMYVWNPSNFSVNYANSAGNGVVASGSNYVRFGDGTQIYWCTNLGSGSILFYVPFIDTNYAVVYFSVDLGVSLGPSYIYKQTTSVRLECVKDVVCIGRWK